MWETSIGCQEPMRQDPKQKKTKKSEKRGTKSLNHQRWFNLEFDSKIGVDTGRMVIQVVCKDHHKD